MIRFGSYWEARQRLEKEKMRGGFVYLVLVKSGIVKIGSTGNPSIRFSELCGGNRLNLSCMFEGNPDARITSIVLSASNTQFRKIERRLHVALSPWKAGIATREHFSLPDSLFHDLVDLFQNGFEESAFLQFEGNCLNIAEAEDSENSEDSPREERGRIISFMIAEEELEAIQGESKARNISVSQWLREAVREKLAVTQEAA